MLTVGDALVQQVEVFLLVLLQLEDFALQTLQLAVHVDNLVSHVDGAAAARRFIVVFEGHI